MVLDKMIFKQNQNNNHAINNQTKYSKTLKIQNFNFQNTC